jgi:hypothetical protein
VGTNLSHTCEEFERIFHTCDEFVFVNIEDQRRIPALLDMHGGYIAGAQKLNCYISI